MLKTDDEKIFKIITKILKNHELEVRREKLARGDSFRVKSGDCNFRNKKIVFIDARLPIDQQVSALVDYLVLAKIQFNTNELDELPQNIRNLIG
ncbi:MAG: hypothetical protein LBE20_03665 [Deltaproteobacteria bacterium]|jgi:hypothetical protein|nr:hypothetical protein [Deltaproteobacteria bacterium]